MCVRDGEAQAREIGRKIFFGLVAEKSEQFCEMGLAEFPAPHLTWASFLLLRTWFGWVGIDVCLSQVQEGEQEATHLLLCIAGKRRDPRDLRERLADGFWRMQATERYLH